MAKHHVLITDIAWENVDIEREILAEVEAEIVLATSSEAAELAELARHSQCEAIMTNWANVTAEVIAASPRCRMIARYGIGLDNIDLEHCRAHQIAVTNVPDYCLDEVAEHTLALLLSLNRNLGHFSRAIAQGQYDREVGPPLRRLAGQTLGLIGLGNTGRLVAQRAASLGMQILGTNRTQQPVSGVALTSLDALLAESDYISLHLPLTPQTHHLLGANEFALMKPTAFLINTARGGLVDHDALATALQKGQLAGAALDVQTPEPPPLDQPPYNDPRLILTPHVAFQSVDSLHRLRSTAAKQVAVHLQGGTPPHLQTPEDLGLS